MRRVPPKSKKTALYCFSIGPPLSPLREDVQQFRKAGDDMIRGKLLAGGLFLVQRIRLIDPDHHTEAGRVSTTSSPLIVQRPRTIVSRGVTILWAAIFLMANSSISWAVRLPTWAASSTCSVAAGSTGARVWAAGACRVAGP